MERDIGRVSVTQPKNRRQSRKAFSFDAVFDWK